LGPKVYLPDAAPTTESDEEMAESLGTQNLQAGMVSRDDNKPGSACISSVAGGGEVKITKTSVGESLQTVTYQ